MNTRSSLIALLGIGTTVPVLISCQNQAPKQPNIIYIMSDDHACQAISAYGGPLAELAPTPNIYRIAANGILFNRCYVTNSLSGPSSATISDQMQGESILPILKGHTPDNCRKAYYYHYYEAPSEHYVLASSSRFFKGTYEISKPEDAIRSTS